MNACIRDLQAKYDTVVKHLQGHNYTSNDKGFRESDLLLTKEVMELPFLKKFKVPVIDPKDGSKDLANHVNPYGLAGRAESNMCRVFPVTPEAVLNTVCRRPSTTEISNISPCVETGRLRIPQYYLAHFNREKLRVNDPN